MVPPVVSFRGVLADENGKALTDLVGVTFSLYQDSQGGSPLWLETQNVQPDRTGHYAVQLGSITSLPANLFASGEARWLGVQVQDHPEQPRTMLISVPYAMKAMDAETIGGMPPSAFALANLAAPANNGGHGTFVQEANHTATGISGGGKTGYIPEWLSASKLGDSALFQSSTGNLGISTITPAQKFEIDLGNILVRGTDNFQKSGDTASVFVGDSDHQVEAIYASGLAIGAYKVPQAVFVQDKTGNVGVGTTSPKARLDVASTTTAAMHGVSVTASQTGSSFQPTSGVWGDTGQGGNLAVVGTADDGYPVVGVNNSPSGYPGLAAEGFDNTNSSGLVLDAYSAGFGGERMVDVNGNLSCTGTITPVVPIASGSGRVALSSIGAAEDWVEDAGSGELSHGSAVVALESKFAQTVNSDVEYHVFLTPKGDCEGLYVSSETSRGFEVHELRHGQSSVAFDYRIMAKRKGHENVRLDDRTKELEAAKFQHQARLSQK